MGARDKPQGHRYGIFRELLRFPFAHIHFFSYTSFLLIVIDSVLVVNTLVFLTSLST